MRDIPVVIRYIFSNQLNLSESLPCQVKTGAPVRIVQGDTQVDATLLHDVHPLTQQFYGNYSIRLSTVDGLVCSNALLTFFPDEPRVEVAFIDVDLLGFEDFRDAIVLELSSQPGYLRHRFVTICEPTVEFLFEQNEDVPFSDIISRIVGQEA
jgi:hypothetical protein